MGPTDRRPFRALSLGWGVQSFTLACMAALGDIPPFDAAIHADTSYESERTYAFAAETAGWLRDEGLHIYTVRTEHPLVWQTNSTGGTSVFIPAYSLHADGQPGQIARGCTERWKLRPLRAQLQDLRGGRQVSLSLGISLDEWRRAKDSPVGYIKHAFPLLDLRMTRTDCVQWLESHHLPVPPKSACVFCPFRSLEEWREMKRQNGNDWLLATSVDHDIRGFDPPSQLFVHRACRPLEQAVAIPEDYGLSQLAFGCDEGVCWT